MRDNDNRLVLLVAKGTEALTVLERIKGASETRTTRLRELSEQHALQCQSVNDMFGQTVHNMLAEYNARMTELEPFDDDNDDNDNEL